MIRVHRAFLGREHSYTYEVVQLEPDDEAGDHQ
ncbi:MAG: hypothetical protein JWR32_2309 [Mycobacterium sp.]|jgi:hypothetical protein|nr:hypothetical protein [Mycobacterium sp.]